MIYLNANMVLFYIFVQTDQINGMTVLSFFLPKEGPERQHSICCLLHSCNTN